jgi:molybdopterin molybdotransferase
MSDGMAPASVRVVRSVDEHRSVVRALLAPLADRLGADELAVSAERMSQHPHDYDGRVLATDVTAPIDLPPFDNSQMDGYAVVSDDLVDAAGERPVSLRVARHIPAGSTGRPLERGWAAPIMTGAPIPDGADAVVPIEQVDPPRFFADDARARSRHRRPRHVSSRARKRRRGGQPPSRGRHAARGRAMGCARGIRCRDRARASSGARHGAVDGSRAASAR